MYFFMHQHMNRAILWIIGLGGAGQDAKRKVKEDMAQGKKKVVK